MCSTQFWKKKWSYDCFALRHKYGEDISVFQLILESLHVLYKVIIIEFASKKSSKFCKVFLISIANDIRRIKRISNIQCHCTEKSFFRNRHIENHFRISVFRASWWTTSYVSVLGAISNFISVVGEIRTLTSVSIGLYIPKTYLNRILSETEFWIYFYQQISFYIFAPCWF